MTERSSSDSTGLMTLSASRALMLGHVSGMEAARSEWEGINSRLGTGDGLRLASEIGELQDLWPDLGKRLTGEGGGVEVTVRGSEIILGGQESFRQRIEATGPAAASPAPGIV